MKDCSLEEKTAILAECSKWSDPFTGRLVNNSLKNIVKKFKPISRRTIQRIYGNFKRDQKGGLLIPKIAIKRKGRCGRHSKLTNDLRQVYIKIGQEYANMWLRLTVRILQIELSKAHFHLSLITISHHLKLMNSKIHNIKIKPDLSPSQKNTRLNFILNMADRSHGLERPEHHYKDQYDTVHVDETWFYLNYIQNKILVFDGIVIPDAPTTRHRSHIVKVMFLVAMARPRKFPEGNDFDGKIGLWPCVSTSPAKRNSNKRPKGTLITQSRSMDSEFYYELFTKPGGVIEKIKEKMPWLIGKTVKIQHDGAPPHSGSQNETLISQFGSVGDWRFNFVTQPPQSPDLNILDLGFFHSLKVRVRHIKNRAFNIDDLIRNINQAYEEYDAATLDDIWGHLYANYNEILIDNGGNQFPPPHVKGRTLQKISSTSVNLNINVEAYNRVYNTFYKT